MGQHNTRDQIISYVAPHIKLFPTQYALVFGTRHGVSTFAHDTASLYRQGYFKKLVISGGFTSGNQSEAQVIFRELRMLEVPAHVMLLEEAATNTGENVAFSRAMLAGLEITEVLLIGKISSKRRYLMTMRKQWPTVGHICCHGVNYFSSDEQHWWRDKDFRERVINEIRKTRSYLHQGLISEVSIVDGVVM